MTLSVCPYCRTVIEPNNGNALLCTGCGTPHHADCYSENGGCTVFGCSVAPADETKVTLTDGDLSGPVSGTLQGNVPELLPGVGLTPPGWTPPSPTKPTKPAPPPLPPGVSAPEDPPVALPAPRWGASSVLFGIQPVAAVATAPSNAATDFDFVPHPDAKNRMTFIVLGVLFGAFGAHNFYAGYKRKAIGQLSISVLTLGLGSPMSWVWAVIDICTVEQDREGIKFKS